MLFFLGNFLVFLAETNEFILSYLILNFHPIYTYAKFQLYQKSGSGLNLTCHTETDRDR